MELGLRLRDASEPMKFLQENGTQEAQRSFTKIKRSSGGLNLGTSLRLNQEMEKSRGIDEENGENEYDRLSEGVGSDGDQGEAWLQLNLLLFPPVPREISTHVESLPWSPDNGSSENDSSRNKGPPATRRLDVNRLPAAAEEVSTANSEGSMFQMDFGKKRDFEATGNERESFRASDDDDGNTRKKLRLSKQQSVFLEQSFKEHPTLNPFAVVVSRAKSLLVVPLYPEKQTSKTILEAHTGGDESVLRTLYFIQASIWLLKPACKGYGIRLTLRRCIIN